MSVAHNGRDPTGRGGRDAAIIVGGGSPAVKRNASRAPAAGWGRLQPTGSCHRLRAGGGGRPRPHSSLSSPASRLQPAFGTRRVVAGEKPARSRLSRSTEDNETGPRRPPPEGGGRPRSAEADPNLADLARRNRETACGDAGRYGIVVSGGCFDGLYGFRPARSWFRRRCCSSIAAFCSAIFLRSSSSSGSRRGSQANVSCVQVSRSPSQVKTV